MLTIFHSISKNDITKAEKILTDNGIEMDEAQTVLQAIGYALLDTELYGNEKSDELHNKETLLKGKDQIRKTALQSILNIMERHDAIVIKINSTDNPVLSDHPGDVDEAYTLDKIIIQNRNQLCFSGSNSHDGDWFDQDMVSTDILVNIAAWLEENEDNIEDWIA